LEEQLLGGIVALLSDEYTDSCNDLGLSLSFIYP
jgi:hypothetical protein